LAIDVTVIASQIVSIIGHEWRTIPNNVAEGEGCPQCGMAKELQKKLGKLQNRASYVC
jgi:hypothetical protein